MFQEGDIVEIPLPDGRSAVGWILHISERFKDAVGFIVFGVKGQIRNEDVMMNPKLDVLGPLYTHIDAIKHYGWNPIAHQTISESTRMLTKRRVGGDVYLGDDCLGSVEKLDGYNLKPMRAMGMPLIYNEIERAFGNEGKTVPDREKLPGAVLS
jgi:hypothetical protein